MHVAPEHRKVDLCHLEKDIHKLISAYAASRIGRNVVDSLHNVLDCIDQERELL